MLNKVKKIIGIEAPKRHVGEDDRSNGEEEIDDIRAEGRTVGAMLLNRPKEMVQGSGSQALV